MGMATRHESTITSEGGRIDAHENLLTLELDRNDKENEWFWLWYMNSKRSLIVSGDTSIIF